MDGERQRLVRDGRGRGWFVMDGERRCRQRLVRDGRGKALSAIQTQINRDDGNVSSSGHVVRAHSGRAQRKRCRDEASKDSSLAPSQVVAVICKPA
jgi:hypothetical protein